MRPPRRSSGSGRYATCGLPSLGGQYADTAADAAAAQLARIALDRDTREAARDHTTASSDLASETLPVPRLSPPRVTYMIRVGLSATDGDISSRSYFFSRKELP